MNPEIYNLLFSATILGTFSLFILALMAFKMRRSLKFKITQLIAVIAVLSNLFTNASRIYERGTSQYYIMLLTVLGIALVITLLFTSRLFKQIITPLETITTHTKSIAQGDFSKEIPSTKLQSEVGILYKEMSNLAQFLRDLIMKNQNYSKELASLSEELSSSAEEVSSSSESIASSQQQISRGAANQVTSITEEQKQFVKLSEGIQEIHRKMDEINEVSELIKNIAEQTSLLSLNAAIEAARAGEAGRGFSIVADQVKKLSDQSHQAASTTEEKLTQIRQITQIQQNQAIAMMKTIDGIVSVAEDISATTEETAAAAEEQAAAMETITSSATELVKIAENIKNSLLQFKT